MSSERLAGVFVALSVSLAADALSADDTPVLTARPDTCVTLHKGQTCYRQVTLTWSGIEPTADYCLWREGDAAALVCWRGGELGTYRHEYASPGVERYRLAVGGSTNDEAPALAEISVSTAWVYRRSRRGGWRLF